MLAQFLELIFNLKAQLPKVFNIDLVFAGTPVLRVGAVSYTHLTLPTILLV